ncbi:hypothetical protein ElyMa_004347500 [Elysia marginata]|uniref:Uncharacterized protein n=1 Tax=Elysia marginata TaxID=1093978 RepID=A0AAV4H586_9GAST|nr:hypothetical protein ElyMa_004347500 [Elysia marginata]
MKSSQDPYLSLLELRTTPLSNNLPAPGELLYHCRTSYQRKSFDHQTATPSSPLYFNGKKVKNSTMTKMQSNYHLFQLTRMSQSKASPPRHGNRQPSLDTQTNQDHTQSSTMTATSYGGIELRSGLFQVHPNYTRNQVQVQQQHTVHLSTLMYLDNQLATTRHKNHHRCTTNRWSTLQCRWPP